MVDAVIVRCAYRDTVLYSLLEVDIELGRIPMQVKQAVTNQLCVSVLLGTEGECCVQTKVQHTLTNMELRRKLKVGEKSWKKLNKF